MTLKRLTATERLLRDRKRSAYKRLLRRLITHKGYRKQSRSEEVLGYTQAQFVAHIERQFEQGMAWGLIHVDHIVPIAAFFDAGIDDPKIINALANLRPMWPKPNQQKSDKYNRRNFAADLDHIMRGLV